MFGWQRGTDDKQVMTNLPSRTSPPPVGDHEYWFDFDYAVITMPVSVTFPNRDVGVRC
jgi:hypothetical protein